MVRTGRGNGSGAVAGEPLAPAKGRGNDKSSSTAAKRLRCRLWRGVGSRRDRCAGQLYLYARAAGPVLERSRHPVFTSSCTRRFLPDKPVFDADAMNLFLVVEAGDHHVSVLDGDKMERIHRFPSRFALHGGQSSARRALCLLRFA